MSFETLRQLDLQTVLTRLSRPQYVARMVTGVKYCALVVGGLFLAYLAYEVVSGMLASQEMQSQVTQKVDGIVSQLKASPVASPGGVEDIDKVVKNISSSTAFGTLGITAAPPPTPPPAPKKPLTLGLIGTFLSVGQEPYAIIEDKKKQTQDVFLLEQGVFDQGRLVTIYSDRVEIERDGSLEVLRLDELGGGDGAAAASPTGDEIVVDEAELNQGLENLPLLLTQARAVPYFKEGRSIGLRLFAIKTGSLYEKIGLKNGDILKSINGNSLGDISQALKLFEQLKQERSIALVLERDKQDREFKYSIR